MDSTPTISPVMHAVAMYTTEATRRALPDVVVEKTKHHVLDTIAAMISGGPLLPGVRAISYVRSLGGTPESTVVGTDVVTTAINAALANGMLAHADETDDSHAPSLTHPGCGIVPAALAMAEREHRDGTAFLRAVALGYDVGCRMTMALHAYDFRRVGHSTHSFGPMFGAAAAAGALAGVSYDQARHLLSYTAQQASGVSCWMRDAEHVEKAFDFGGMPARNGVAAATMVANGFTGVDDVFAGQRSFFVAYDESARIGKAPEPERLMHELGSRFEVMSTNIKRWSVGSPIQAPLDGLLDLILEHAITADDVARLVVRVSHQGADTVDDRDMPDICLQHLCALMLVDGIVTFESAHDEARMHDPAVRAVRRRIELYGDDEMTRVMPSRQAVIEMTLTDGRELRYRVEAVLGTADNPMTRQQIDEKCFHLVAPILGEGRGRDLCDAVWSLEDVASMDELRPLLVG
jgi:2-methylcitrate dehydratase PrpD